MISCRITESLSNTVPALIIMFIFETPLLSTVGFDVLNISMHCLCFAVVWSFHASSKNISDLIFSIDVVFILIAQNNIVIKSTWKKLD